MGTGCARWCSRARCSPGVMIRQCPVLATTLVGRTDLKRSDNRIPILTAFLRCARTYMSGVAIGSERITTGAHRRGIRRGRKRGTERPRGEVRGDTRSRSRDARLAPAFRQNSSTRTMAFGWCETSESYAGLCGCTPNNCRRTAVASIASRLLKSGASCNVVAFGTRALSEPTTGSEQSCGLSEPIRM